MLLKTVPLIYRKRRPATSRRKPPTPVPGPVLVAASYDVLTPSLTLTFDRPVDLAGEGGVLNAETITVHDGINGIEQLNTPDAAGAGTTTLVVTLFPNAAWAGEGVTLSAGAGTGIVAADDSTPWAGVTSLELPFP
jgi:hypothetical protein